MGDPAKLPSGWAWQERFCQRQTAAAGVKARLVFLFLEVNLPGQARSLGQGAVRHYLKILSEVNLRFRLECLPGRSLLAYNARHEDDRNYCS